LQVKELLDLLKDPVTKATLSRRAACIHALSRTVNYYASNADASQETGIKHLRELLVALEQSESVTLFSTFTDTCVDECHRIFEHVRREWDSEHLPLADTTARLVSLPSRSCSARLC